MRWVFGLAATLAFYLPTATQAAEPVQVMVLGTYHFGNPGLDLANAKADDVLKPQRQKELDTLSAALAGFRPTKIMIERLAKTADLADPRFAEFTVADLGKNRDERLQIAYRLASRLGIKEIYAIDEQPSEGEPDYFPFDKVVAWSSAHGQKARVDALLAEAVGVTKLIEQWQAEGSVGHVLLELNRPERTAKDQDFYYQLLGLGDTEAQPGADLNAMWYLRNAKIFGKLMTVAKPGDRILVVYGAGHNYWLRHFARATPGYVNVDPTPFLEKAAKASR